MVLPPPFQENYILYENVFILDVGCFIYMHLTYIAQYFQFCIVNGIVLRSKLLVKFWKQCIQDFMQYSYAFKQIISVNDKNNFKNACIGSIFFSV